MTPKKNNTLGSIISISKGKKHTITDALSSSSKRLIGIDDLRNDEAIRYTDDKIGTQVSSNDVLIAWDGANAGTIGYGKSGFIGSTIARLRIKKDKKISTQFLGLFLKTKFDYLRKSATGATIPHINRDALESISLPDLEFDDQTRIAHLLSKVEGLIAQRKQHLQQLDDLLKSVFLKMFGDPVRNEKGWNTLQFHKIGKFISGGTPSKSRADFWEGSFPWVSPKDMKVSKIEDAEDHISESVFEETTLKRIGPNHLLIVVRGMILAHSFPVAINTVEVAINQDMKAIKPIKTLNIVYLQHCLNSLKCKILKLISTAGHGTKRFDSVAMQKLFIPNPPPGLQGQFAAVAEKVQDIRTRYQQSLTDLETLYGAISQKAFKGELDLSRIVLPTEQSETTEEKQPVPSVSPEVEVPPTIELPAPDDLKSLLSAEVRKAMVEQWLDSYLGQLGSSVFSADSFMEAAQQRLGELLEDDGSEQPNLGVAEYDQLRTLVFQALENGHLTQSYDDAGNRVQVKSAMG